MKRGLTLCLCLAFCCVTATAQHWPSFRGVNANGVADGAKLPTTWNADKLIMRSSDTVYAVGEK